MDTISIKTCKGLVSSTFIWQNYIYIRCQLTAYVYYIYFSTKQLRNEKIYLEREQTEYNYIMSFWFPLFGC